MTVYKNTRFVKRDYESTNVVACVAIAAPAAHWTPVDAGFLIGLTMLWIEAGVRYYGYL